MESPPKRITRARAAAKAGEVATKPPTKVATAAIKARAGGTATAGTKSTTAKRKTRADETDGDDGSQPHTTAARALRARPRRVAEAPEDPSVAASAKATRTRGPAKKKADEPPAKRDAVEAETTAPPRTRGRPKRTPVPVTEAKDTAPETTKKATRSRPATTSKAASGAAAKPAAAAGKKTVKFQEPDKENVEPKHKPKEPAPTGLRGRPARRGGAATTAARSSTRATAAAAASEDGGRKKPLSPKKVTQMPVSRDGDSSEDELAAENIKTPVKALKMSPIKPPTGARSRARSRDMAKDDSGPSKDDSEPAAEHNAVTSSSLGSPPRRLPASPVKDSLKSPAKRMGQAVAPGSVIKPSTQHLDMPGLAPGSKTPLLQSAAKRPQSPIKGLCLPPAAASGKPLHSQSAFKSSMFQSPAKRAMPGWRPLTEPRSRAAPALDESPELHPLVMGTPSRSTGGWSSKELVEEDGASDDEDEEVVEEPPFSGRLSSVLPRHIDPAMREGTQTVVEEKPPMEEPEGEAAQLMREAMEVVEAADRTLEAASFFPEHYDVDLDVASAHADVDNDVDPMALDEIVAEMEDSAQLLPQDELPPPVHPMFQLREKDMDPCHHLQSESEDEDDDTRPGAEYMAPSPVRPTQTPRGRQSRPDDSRRLTIGLTSLAEQFGSWTTVSPTKPAVGRASEAPTAAEETREAEDELLAASEELLDSPFKGSFFDDEMLVHTDLGLDAGDAMLEESGGVDDQLPETPLEEIAITEEDVALAQEAHDMSAMEPEQIDAVVNGRSFDDSLSEASQEYGDENQAPVEELPAAPSTPIQRQRPLKGFFTTTKVPLKPADDSTPSPLKKGSMSASRVSHRRPGSLSRSATVISYSPPKGKKQTGSSLEDEAEAPPCPPATPVRAEAWSAMGTPARTPRRDLNPALLRGAVVFVDVHTTEGADASGIFVELLSQMGARCVRAWQWNPSGPADAEASSSKVGITHVVYKDGGKRTLEKVRWAKGVVHCVGVSWVLDCERENEWLDEAAFCIDTSSMPRGGARRRKSMEPKALANLNGTVVSSPAKGSPTRTPAAPANRRDSTLWMHTPSDGDDDEAVADDDLEWSCVLLTPVPKTPAPEAVARYAAALSGSPGDDDSDYVDSSPAEQALMTRTCPPKRSQYRDMGEGILAREKDEQVLMRLMAARRKSLQFAPKIGSPLAKTWG